ncbi:MAG: hypothetical protein FWD55_03705 [Propionibacteriaceae bacterium]|nr:hypothetical protein [Propionibacteriaceae bacterium]
MALLPLSWLFAGLAAVANADDFASPMVEPWSPSILYIDTESYGPPVPGCPSGNCVVFAPRDTNQQATGRIYANRSSSDQSIINVSVEIRNPNGDPVTLSYVEVTCFNGLTYISGSVNGVGAPTVTGGNLSFPVSGRTIAANGNFSFSFAVKDAFNAGGSVIALNGGTIEAGDIDGSSVTPSAPTKSAPPVTTQAPPTTAGGPSSTSVPKPPVTTGTTTAPTSSPTEIQTAGQTTKPTQSPTQETTPSVEPQESESPSTQPTSSPQPSTPPSTPEPEEPIFDEGLDEFLTSNVGAATMGGTMMVVAGGGAAVLRRFGI